MSNTSKLVRKDFKSTAEVSSGNSNTSNYWAMSANNTSINWDTHLGWYFDFPQTSERLLKQTSFFDASNILAVYSQVPARGSTGTATETCERTSVEDERQYLTLLNIMDGLAPSVQVMDLNADGIYNQADKGVSRMSVAKGANQLIKKGQILVNVGAGQSGGGGGEDSECAPGVTCLAAMPETSLRPSWRQFQ